ncbi:1,4-alpha-glucan branching protein GlgB [Streptacidiphilus cavernicola]|uniref:1,4-alpha-glucan branching enzyme GlgB n=1 Tax=Streptacidiphilus cavernicola TaxID=3342716 RepID=A0ABV6VQS6_9ACTN
MNHPASGERAPTRALLAGVHPDPHSLLGPHPDPDGVVLRVLCPRAEQVTAVAGRCRVRLRPEGHGLFTGLLPGRGAPDYQLEVADGDRVRRVDDPYRFPPTVGPEDLELIAGGRHRRLWRVLGAHTRELPAAGRTVAGTAFAVWAPGARGVRLSGDFNGWLGAGHPMRRLGESGVWELFVPGAGDGARYTYEVLGPDGVWQQKADPLATAAERPPSTASLVCTPRHAWGDAGWMGRRDRSDPRAAPTSVYEVHLGSWRAGLGYRELARELPRYVKDLGFSHVEFMPVAEHPFAGSWGYQVTSYYAPTARLGSPDDFRLLVDALHRAGVGVLLDWVPGYFPRDDWALARFDGSALYETADSADRNRDGADTLAFDYARPQVRDFLIANALFWCEEFHVDGLRVDAPASMLYRGRPGAPRGWAPDGWEVREDPDAAALLRELNTVLHRRFPGVATIAGACASWAGVTAPVESGGLGFDFGWNAGWAHDTLAYLQEDPVHRQFHHGRMTSPMRYAYAERHILPVSHDDLVHGRGSLLAQIPGDPWQKFATLRAYLAFQWAQPGRKLLFMGQELGQPDEWWHEGELGWDLPEIPGQPGERHRGVRTLVRDLNRLQRSVPALWQRDDSPDGFDWIAEDAAQENMLAFVRHDAAGEPLVCVYNFCPVPRTGLRLPLPRAGRWQEVLNTDSHYYGGTGTGNQGAITAEPGPVPGTARTTLLLPALAALWLRPGDPAPPCADQK